MGQTTSVRIKKFNNIYSYLENKSKTIKEYLDERKDSDNFSLWIKTIAHSDVITKGKRSGKNQSLDKNILYYLSFQEMKKIEQQQENSFCTAKQSNIGLPKAFFEDINIKKLKRRKGPQSTHHEHKKLNERNNIYLVNDTLKFFTNKYTKKVIEVLDKNEKWAHDDVRFSNTEFTEIEISQAIHGIGIAGDTEFFSLRKNIFVNDIICFLVEKRKNKNNIFILLEKNPKFFSLIGETNQIWENYLLETRKKSLYSMQVSESSIFAEENTVSSEEKSRKYQSAWKDMLAKEMMVYSSHEGEIFCPFTYISAPYECFSMLFIASHIKSFATCSEKEAYDVNNGLLLVSNVDSLFDKHLITISEDKTLMFSFLLKNNSKLRQKLMLNEYIFDLILNEDRMKYLRHHRQMFFAKEEMRKSQSI